MFIQYTRRVRKIRSPRRWNREELACSLAPHLQIPTKPSPLRRSVLTGQPFAMEVPLASFARCELRAVIRFLSAKGTTPIDIHRQLCEVYGPQCMNVKNVRKWVREFMYGRTDVHDERRSGRPSVSAETIAQVEQEMLEDRRATVRELCERIPDVSKTTIDKILTEHLHYRKVRARWVPKMLSEDYKRQGVEAARGCRMNKSTTEVTD